MAAVKSGDRIIISTRPLTIEDSKSGLYYAYFGGLVGTADRVYDDGSVCVDVDLESLSEETRARHLVMQENERKRWLDNLSDEGRNRLTADQKQLKISYKLLVSQSDLQPYTGAPRAAAKPIKADADASSDEGSKGPARTPEPEQEPDLPQAKRISSADLEAAEEAYLRSKHNDA